MGKVLIVGGVAGGATAAARLRRLDEGAEIVMFERGGYISYANCGLPYYIGGEIADKSALELNTPEGFRARFNIDVRVRHEVTAIDRAAKTVAVTDLATGARYTEGYDKLILSPGASPVVPDIPGIGSARVFKLRDIPDAYRIRDFLEGARPASAVVCGGGYIGVEMAENLQKAGLSVTVVEMSDQVIAPLDYDMACGVHAHMRQKGVNLLLNCAVRRVEDTGAGLRVHVSDSQSDNSPDDPSYKELAADMLVMAVGVKPDSRLAVSAGLSVNGRGGIAVDSRMRTSDADIYAVGDAAEVTDFVTRQKAMVALAGPANKQARVAAENICGLDSHYRDTQGSAILRVFDMAAAVTGINEKTARRAGISYDKVYTYPLSHAGYYPGAASMCVKTLYEPGTGRILGAQLTGPEGADKRCDVFAAAIRAGMTAYDLTRLELCYAPPYSSAKDPVNTAGCVIENILTGKVKTYHWHDVAGLPRDGSAALIDVRMPEEYAAGHIDGFANIPLDELRARLNELDRAKKVYVTCQVGLRGYTASRILTQNGFDAYNLSGGYELYSTVRGEGERG